MKGYNMLIKPISNIYFVKYFSIPLTKVLISGIIKLRHKTKYSIQGCTIAILVLSIFSYACMEVLCRSKSGVLYGGALALRAHFLF